MNWTCLKPKTKQNHVSCILVFFFLTLWLWLCVIRTSCLFLRSRVSIFSVSPPAGGENHHDSASGHEAATVLHHTQQQDRDLFVSCHRCLRFLRLLLHPSALGLLALFSLCCRLAILHTAHAHTYVGVVGKHEHTGTILTADFRARNHITGRDVSSFWNFFAISCSAWHGLKTQIVHFRRETWIADCFPLFTSAEKRPISQTTACCKVKNQADLAVEEIQDWKL